MEHIRQEDVIYQTVHTHYTYDLNIKDPINSTSVTCNYEDWNIYAVEWTEDKITFFVNDQKTFSYENLKLANEEEMKQISSLDMGYSGSRAKHFEPDFVRMVLNNKIHD